MIREPAACGNVDMCSACRKLRYLPLGMDLCSVCWRPFLAQWDKARRHKIRLTKRPKSE